MVRLTPPTRIQTARALRTVAEALGEPYAYRVGARYFFPLGEGWYAAISPDDAGRFRVDACRGTAPVATLWSAAQDHDRLAGLIQGLRDQVAAPAA